MCCGKSPTLTVCFKWEILDKQEELIATLPAIFSTQVSLAPLISKLNQGTSMLLLLHPSSLSSTFISGVISFLMDSAAMPLRIWLGIWLAMSVERACERVGGTYLNY